jgi:hypothetical protein
MGDVAYRHGPMLSHLNAERALGECTTTLDTLTELARMTHELLFNGIALISKELATLGASTYSLVGHGAGLGRGLTTCGHQNQRPSSAAMDGVMKARMTNVSNRRPIPIVVPT